MCARPRRSPNSSPERGFEHIRHPRTLRPFVTGIVTARKPQ